MYFKTRLDFLLHVGSKMSHILSEYSIVVSFLRDNARE
jgi:hypothetical protein